MDVLGYVYAVAITIGGIAGYVSKGQFSKHSNAFQQVFLNSAGDIYQIWVHMTWVSFVWIQTRISDPDPYPDPDPH